MTENQQPVDNSQENHQQPVDNSQENQQSVDNSQENQQPVDNSQENQQPVDNSPENNTTDVNGNDFDAQAYINGLQPEEAQPNMEQLQNENKLLKQQRDALKDAYLKLKSNGITLVTNPDSQAKKSDPNAEADAMLKRWMHS